MKANYNDGRNQIYQGNCLDVLKTLPEQSVNCCVTSPPYWGLRDYGCAGQIGLEKTPEEYVESLVNVFREVWRVLRDDGTAWINLGDSYARNGGTQGGGNRELLHMQGTQSRMCKIPAESGLKEKDLVGIPWRVAFALQADGWYLRSQIPWVKRNAMPESVTDRPSSACEMIFLLSKFQSYYYDHDAVKLPASMSFVNDSRHNTGSTPNNAKNGYLENGAQNPKGPHRMFDKQRGHSHRHAGFNDRLDAMSKTEQCAGWRSTRNSDWFFEGLLTDSDGNPLAMAVNPTPYLGAHFATFPPNLVKPCILAGCPVGGTVLDPFGGSGTTGMVATQLGRKSILIELNPEYCEMANNRTNITQGLPLA